MTPAAAARTSLLPDAFALDARLRDLLAGVLAFVGVMPVEGTLLDANEPAVASSGVPRKGALSLDGPTVTLPGDQAHAVGLMLHELATNAAKDGALRADGTVRVTWAPEGPGAVRLTWIERGGPPVAPPTRRGFGTRLVAQSLAATEDDAAQFDFAPERLTVTMRPRSAWRVGPACTDRAAGLSEPREVGTGERPANLVRSGRKQPQRVPFGSLSSLSPEAPATRERVRFSGRSDHRAVGHFRGSPPSHADRSLTGVGRTRP